MGRAKQLGLAALVLALVLGLLVFRPESWTYTLDFTGLPADDTALLTWLQVQPGVRNAVVQRAGQTITVTFEVGAATPPEVVAQTRALGYTGLRRSALKRTVGVWSVFRRPQPAGASLEAPADR